MGPRPGADKLIEALMGKVETVPTRKGQLSARRGGVPGLLASLAGGTANLPGLGPILSSDAPPMSEASAIHENLGHEEGKGALYDIGETISGRGTPEGMPSAYWRPSEVYGYTTQPAELSSDEIKNVFGLSIMKNPKLMEYYLSHRNPESDWPKTIEEFQQARGGK